MDPETINPAAINQAEHASTQHFLEEQKIQNCLSRVLSAEDILTLPPKKNFHKISQDYLKFVKDQKKECACAHPST